MRCLKMLVRILRCNGHVLLLLIVFFSFIIGYCFYLKYFIIKKHELYVRMKYLETELIKRNEILTREVSNRNKDNYIKNKFAMYLSNDKKNKFSELMRKLLSQRAAVSAVDILNVEKKGFFTELLVKTVFTLDDVKTVDDFVAQIADSQSMILSEKFSWNYLNDGSRIKKVQLTILFRIYLHDINIEKFTLEIANFNKNKKKNFKCKPPILGKYPIYKLKMIGVLYDNLYKRYWGIIKAPNAQIKKVEINDLVGLEQGMVIAIDLKRIFILSKDFKKIIELPIEEQGFNYGSLLS